MMIGQPAVGTIPHALILILGDTVRAISAFDERIDRAIPRIALIDTFGDEKFEAIRVAEALGDSLYAIRLDTPSSRRGDFAQLLEEVRWELDLRGHQNVKIFISGGLSEHTIRLLNPFADGYGVGTAISNSPVVDFSLDIVEIEGKPLAKRGKRSGRKTLVASPSGERRVLPASASITEGWKPLLKQVIRDGKIMVDLPSVKEIRDRVLESLEHVTLENQSQA
jgi:nicotinate phosphoribosyltransferase